MYIDFVLDENAYFKDIIIKPDEKMNERADVLHDIACQLSITNPCPEFVSAVKTGAYNALSNEEYEDVLIKMKMLNKLIYEDDGKSSPKLNINIFQFAVRLLKLLFNYEKQRKKFEEQLKGE